LFVDGALVTNWGTSISRTIAEAALMMILGCLRRVRPAQEELHNRRGYRSVPKAHSLFERSVGLYGFGAIARELVQLLKPFQVQIRAYDPYVPSECFVEYGVEQVTSLEVLFGECDIISLHAAKTPETFGVVNKKMLDLLPDDGVIVNTSRGSLVNEADLAEQLRAGRLWAALDVYEPEPIAADSPLRGQERILLFPHSAGPTEDRLIDMGRLAVGNIRRYLTGEPVLHRVTTAQYDLMT
jgi:phosphoglycerate dehydrogenase-like enzyme